MSSLPVADPSILESEKDKPLLKAAHNELSVPIREGLPVVVLFSKPILKALRSSCLPLSVGRSHNALSVTLEKALPAKAPLLWVELEDHALYAIRLVEATRKTPAQARITAPPASSGTPATATQKDCCS